MTATSIIESNLNISEKIKLPACSEFYAGNNHFCSFSDLPEMTELIKLDLSRNNITQTDGLENFKKLSELTLTECPISFDKLYRERYFDKCISNQLVYC